MGPGNHGDVIAAPVRHVDLLAAEFTATAVGFMAFGSVNVTAEFVAPLITVTLPAFLACELP